MKKITINDSTCLYLDHRKLIARLYQDAVKKDAVYYTFHSDLFDFRPRLSCQQRSIVDNIEDGKRRRKRKWKTSTNLADQRLIAPESLQAFLGHIKNFLPCKDSKIKQMPRYWEEEYTIPQLRGANETEYFQNVTLQNERNYLIPPFTKFFNGDLRCQNNDNDAYQSWPSIAQEKYDLIIIDIPWRNKYIRRLRKIENSLAYKMLDNKELERMPIDQLTHSHSLVALWCTNSQQHQKILLEDCLPKWKLKLVHQLKWFKLNKEGELITDLKDDQKSAKKPYEMLYLACHKDRPTHASDKDLQALTGIHFLASIPSLIHSHKPPLTQWLKDYIYIEPDCQRHWRGLEIFARYLQPHFTSIGLEVLKLMDSRLYCTFPSLNDSL